MIRAGHDHDVRRLLPDDELLLAFACSVSLTALVASTLRISAATPAWATAAVMLDGACSVLLARAIHRIARWMGPRDLAVPDGIQVGVVKDGPGPIRIEISAAPIAARRRLFLGAISVLGLALLHRLAAATGRPDHAIVVLGGIAGLVAAAVSFATPLVVLLVDVELRQVESTSGTFRLQRGATLRVARSSLGAVLRMDGTEPRPLLDTPSFDAAQLREVARTLAALLGELDVAGE